MTCQHSFANVLICEDHYVTALGLEMLLQKHSSHPLRTRTALTGKKALTMAQQDCPDLAIVDLTLPDLSGVEVIKGLRTHCPSARIIVLTAAEDPHLIRQACQLRVDAVLRKINTDQNLQEALEFLALRKKKPYLDPSVQKILEATPDRSLTPKEYEVVEFMALGLTSGEIAKKMGCALATVKTYRSRIMGKSGSRNSAEIMAWYLKGNGKRNFGSGS